MYENSVYDGILKCLKNLKSSNHRIYLATSKPIIYASKILSHFKLTEYFDGEYGSELDGTRKDKTDLIKYILAKENLEVKNTYMVGDRKHDLIGARNNGVAQIAVSYGYGSNEELEQESPSAILKKPTDICRYFDSVLQ